MRSLFLIVLAGLATFLRLLWINEMEFKGDEAEGVHFLTQVLPHLPFSPLGLIAGHSGFSHSSGFAYFVRILSFGASDPVWIAAAIALSNSLGIALGLLLCRKSEKGFLTFAMCATSLNLVLGSRKIWSPDLVAFWIYLFLGGFIYSFSENLESKKMNITKKSQLILGLSAFCLTLAGHMYPPGVLFALMGTGCITLWLFWNGMKSRLTAWVVGSGVGWLTWIPYGYSLAIHADQAIRRESSILDSLGQNFSWLELWNLARTILTLPSPQASANLYLFKYLPSIKAYNPSFLVPLIVSCMIILTLLWSLGFIASWIQIFHYRKKITKDPLLILSILILIGTGIALELISIGNYLHYWFGAIPFAYYLMAWAYSETSQKTRDRFHLRAFLWTGVGGSAIAVLLFLCLVRQMGGLPGEYGRSYRVLKTLDNNS